MALWIIEEREMEEWKVERTNMFYVPRAASYFKHYHLIFPYNPIKRILLCSSCKGTIEVQKLQKGPIATWKNKDLNESESRCHFKTHKFFLMLSP